jgi:uncharacterized protein YeaO (DUF488 family)/DNA-binding MarR family transcriptional regulator
MTLSDDDYARLLALRAGLRHFQRWSEQQAKAAGLTPAQHQLLLAIRGHRDARGPTIGEVADYLLRGHHSTVELIDRADAAGLVIRSRDPDDHRVVRLQLTDLGSARLEVLSELHLEELDRLALDVPAAWDGLAPVQRAHGFAGDPSASSETLQVGLARAREHLTRRGRKLILVDRRWPRGVRRDDEAFDVWLKDVAPSPDLDRWYGRVPNRFDEFARRYRQELAKTPARDALRQLREVASTDNVALVTAAKDIDHSAAAVLRDVLVSL